MIIVTVANKKVLNVLPAPLTVASIQLGIGAIYVCTLWMLNIRTVPKLSPSGIDLVKRVGFFHSAGQLLTVTALAAGTVSFAHIVKASEPFFSAGVSVIVFGRWMKTQVYLTMIPVVAGVAYACFQDTSFSFAALSAALGSNVAFALRAVYSKKGMEEYSGEDVTPANLYGTVTCFAFLLSMIPSILVESKTLPGMWSNAIENDNDNRLSLVIRIMISGLTHYLNNEVMYLALSNVHPVTLAVGNTLKRVFILFASVLVFKTPMSLQTGVGSATALGGLLLYSLARQHDEKGAAKRQSQVKRPRG